jgi:F-type H+-transporting ATPase subunit gamma
LLATSQFLIPVPTRNFGASEKTLKQRMKTVNNIRKITKAMKMVATSKMKADMLRLQNGKHYGVNAVDMMFMADKYMKDRAPSMPADPEELIVMLSSDKGMCGSINSGAYRSVRDYVN